MNLSDARTGNSKISEQSNVPFLFFNALTTFRFHNYLIMAKIIKLYATSLKQTNYICKNIFPMVSKKKNEQTETPMDKEQSLSDIIRQRVMSRKEGRNFASDDDFYGALGEDYDEFDKMKGEYDGLRKDADDIVAMFESNPETADLWLAVKNGRDPISFIIEEIGVDGLREILDDPERLEDIAEANQKYLERVADEDKFKEEYASNNQISLANDAKAVEDGIMTEEELKKAHESLKRKLNDFLMGKWTTEDLLAELKSIKYDEDVKDAEKKGEIRGRNQKIVERRGMREKGDGIRAIGNSSSVARKQEERKDLGALGKMRRNMW